MDNVVRRSVIAKCPKCGEEEFVEKDDHTWVCLKCDYTKDLSRSTRDLSTGSATAIALLLTIALAIAFLIV
ncbi:MAG TPA: hypothetical protein V6C88_15350 [Chroococcidiopsis sp.]